MYLLYSLFSFFVFKFIKYIILLFKIVVFGKYKLMDNKKVVKDELKKWKIYDVDVF